MSIQARISSQSDREGITELMRRAFGPDLGSLAVDSDFQRWKYWDRHPFTEDGRSFVLDGKDRIVGHACRWPMRLLTQTGAFDAFHLIDWAADSSHAGAGLQVLLDSCDNSAALFSIGGSPTTRRMLPALGQHLGRRSKRSQAFSYQVVGKVYFLSRPLKPFAAALRESPLGWKTPIRLARNTLYAALPAIKLPARYSFTPVALTQIPEELWPLPTQDVAVSARTPELMQHFADCPVLQRPLYFVLTRGGRPIAYFFLTAAGAQVRLADYGPAAIDRPTAHVLGTAVQLAAKQHYPDALRIAAAVSEQTVRSGLLQSGFHQTYEEEIRGLIAAPALLAAKQYRLTYLDLDALCL